MRYLSSVSLSPNMVSKIAIACLSMLVTLTAGLSVANEIYKWTDEEGNVHYGDRPTDDRPAERVPISSKPTDQDRIQAQIAARQETKATAQEGAATEPAGPTPEELEAQAKERREQCETYKARLQKFLTSRRLYREDENGERVYLDEEETLAARERVQDQVKEYCNP